MLTDGKSNRLTQTFLIMKKRISHTSCHLRLWESIHNPDRQNDLEKAFESMYEKNNEVLARIRPDPTNEFDADAIAVELNYGAGWKLVGFLLRNLTQYVHPVINSQKLLSVQVGRIRFQTHWQTPGFYVKLLIKRKGMWPKEVVSASKQVK